MTGLRILSVFNIVRRWIHSEGKSSNKIQFTLTKLQKIYVCSIVVTCVSCGTLLWLEIKDLKTRLALPANIGNIDKVSNPYIYIIDRDVEEEPKSVKDIKKKLFEIDKLREKTWFSWLQSHSLDPWTLLKLTESSVKKTRWLGVKAIAEMDHWEDSQCRYIGQACDGRTLIGLARSDVSADRYFLPAHRLPPLPHTYKDAVRVLLASLPLENVNRCTQYLTALALDSGPINKLYNNEEEVENEFWSDKHGSDHRRLSEKLIMAHYLQALESHTQILSQCDAIVNSGGLFVLLHVVQNLVDELSHHRLRLVARIIANISCCTKQHEEMVRLGWVPILFKWMTTNPDIKVAQLAARTLLNLDRDYTTDLCRDGVYIIHPVHRTSEPICDVIFVHGIMGGPFITWRQRETDTKEDSSSQSLSWPKDWLAVDCPNARILTLEYETHISDWYIRCPYDKQTHTLEWRAQDFLEKLRLAGVGSRPIVWVGHSMGGLIIKQILRLSETDPGLSDVADKTRGIIFYSVPHHGSPLVDTSKSAHYILYPSTEVQELGEKSELLETLHTDFLNFVKKKHVTCLSFGETVKTSIGITLPKIHVVPPEFNAPGIGEYRLIDADHIDICKPSDHNSDLYILAMKLIRHIIVKESLEHVISLRSPGL